MSSQKHRKQVYALTIADFERFGVWEFALDEEGREGQDEATVRPREFDDPLDPADGNFVVRARFTLAALAGPISVMMLVEVLLCRFTIGPALAPDHGTTFIWLGSRKSAML
jgi:hypothetical protein